MDEAILTINAGSSSLKYSLYDLSLSQIEKGKIDGNDVAVAEIIEKFSDIKIKAIGHRIVHGGKEYTEALVVNDNVLTALEKLSPLAPLHLPQEIKYIKEFAKIYPDIPQIACFDTSFHHTQSQIARMFAIPRKLTEEGIIRYGFHGLSYEYIASRLPHIAGDKANGNVIVAHLGSGASMCAMHKLESVATSMGFSALDGLMMATRCGNIDAGAVLYLAEKLGIEETVKTLSEKSGLLGVSGISADIRELQKSDDPKAKEAIELFCYRAAREIGSLAAALGGLDALIFTAGIGENQPEVRKRICELSAWLGIEFDETENGWNSIEISKLDSKTSVYVIQTNEEAILAKHTAKLLS